MFPKNDNDRNATQTVANDNGGHKTPRPTSLGEPLRAQARGPDARPRGIRPGEDPRGRPAGRPPHGVVLREGAVFDVRSISEVRPTSAAARCVSSSTTFALPPSQAPKSVDPNGWPECLHPWRRCASCAIQRPRLRSAACDCWPRQTSRFRQSYSSRIVGIG